METCLRGFSYMAENKTDLQFIEGGELERAWRSTRRERMKLREQMIWDNFVKEQDAVRGICNDDPYQFIDPLPESYLTEVMVDGSHEDIRESAEEEIKVKEQPQHGTGDNSSVEEEQHTCVVTFAEDIDREDNMFHIFDDDHSGSGGEDEFVIDSSSPETVREKPPESDAGVAEQSSETEIDLQKTSSKSSENVASVIESSIYCARVKELRRKIIEELIALTVTLDRRDILLLSETEEITRMVKRSAEFCSRFSRIHMYQIQRQIHDIKRNSSQSLPFAKHTQFQTQMSRIATLHQNLLQSFVVFHKSFSQTCCVRESASALGSLLCAARDATHACLHVQPPKHFTACLQLYEDDLLSTCDKVDEFVGEYAIRCEEFLNRFNTENGGATKKVKKDNKVKRKFWNNNKTSLKNGTDSQLSMYSMMNINARSSNSSKDHIGSISKLRIGSGIASNKRASADKNSETSKSPRRSRRPLMRDPHAGRPRAPKLTRDTEIRTMVEAVETCASSNKSCDSPRAGARSSRHRTPRAQVSSPAKGLPSPSTDRTSPRKNQMPVRPMKPVNRLSPLKTKSRPLHPKPTDTLKESLNATRIEPEAEEQVMPVLTIKCAMKQGLKTEETLQEFSPEELLPMSPYQPLSPDRRETPNDEKKASTNASQLKVMYKHGECSKSDGSPRTLQSPTKHGVLSPTNLNHEVMKKRTQIGSDTTDRCKVSRLLKQLCSGDGSGKTERVTGAKNAQLMYVSGSSPRQPSTPQLLRILEETIKKKIPKPIFQNSGQVHGTDRYRLQFNIGEDTSNRLFQYRTKFVQHMLTSAMYANSAVGKPWEMIGNISEQIIDEVLLKCVSEMELQPMIQELYKTETC